MGEFYFTRDPSDRNMRGRGVYDMLLFKEAINNLGLVALPLKGGNFT